MLPIPTTIKEYAREDIDNIIEQVSDAVGDNLIPGTLKFGRNENNLDSDIEEYSVWVSVIITVRGKGKFEYSWDYVVQGDDVYLGGDDESMVDTMINMYNELESNFNSSTKILSSKQKVTAADGDLDEYNDEGEEEFVDTVDDLTDTVDDMNDLFEGFEEDDIDIEIDNNIVNHFIAECDTCQGIFISSTIESDQQVEKTSGICPICGKETDQYFKWVVKEIDPVL